MLQFRAPQGDGACTVLYSFCQLLMGLMTLGLVACGQPHTESRSPTTLESILITPAQPWLEINGTIQLQATGVYSNGSATSLTDFLEWSSSKPEVATVSPIGIVEGKSGGQTTITVRELNSNIQATVELKVNADDVDPSDPSDSSDPSDPDSPAEPAITHLSVSPSNPVMDANQTVQLSLVGHYDDNTTTSIQSGITWSSANETVATIDEDGVLTSRGPGTTLISASALGLSATTSVRVESEVPVLVSIAISPSSPSVALGQTLQLTARGTFSDGNQSDLTDSVEWVSSSDSVATVSSTGLLTTVAAGAIVIEARHMNPLVVGDMTIVVTGSQISGTGTREDPMVMSAPFTHQSNVDADTAIYYAIPVHPSGKYNIHLRGMTADLGLWVYGNDETYNISAPTCHSLNSGTEDEICSFQGASEGTLYLRVSGILSDDPSTYSLTVEPMPVEELSGTPLTVNHSTEVKEWLIYKLNVTPFETYNITVTGLDGDADLYVSDTDASFASTLCQSEFTGELDESCNGIVPTTNELFIGIDATKSWIGTSYSLNVTQN